VVYKYFGRSNVRIFLDTANIEEIRQAARLGVISGVTTNPSLMMRAGRSDYKEVTQEICYICALRRPDESHQAPPDRRRRRALPGRLGKSKNVNVKREDCTT
jgi:transaldolase